MTWLPIWNLFWWHWIRSNRILDIGVKLWRVIFSVRRCRCADAWAPPTPPARPLRRPNLMGGKKARISALRGHPTLLQPCRPNQTPIQLSHQFLAFQFNCPISSSHCRRCPSFPMLFVLPDLVPHTPRTHSKYSETNWPSLVDHNNRLSTHRFWDSEMWRLLALHLTNFIWVLCVDPWASECRMPLILCFRSIRFGEVEWFDDITM